MRVEGSSDGLRVVIDVVVPLALPMATLSYTAPQGVRVGMRVAVRVREIKRVIGIVRRVGVEAPRNVRLLPVTEILDGEPVVSEREFAFAQWAADYYMASVSEIISSGWSSYFAKQFSGQKTAIKRKKVAPLQPLPQTSFSLTESLKESSKTSSTTLLLHTLSPTPLAPIIGHYTTGGTVLVLTPTHNEAVEVERELARHFSTALYTSTVPIKKRCEVALNIAVGLAPEVVVGTRSALWLSYKSLGSVIITNEAAYHHRMQNFPYVSSRECGVMLAHMHGAQCLLMAESPSIESYYNARYGTWGYLCTPPATKELKSIVLQKGKHLISTYTKKSIHEALDAGKRVIVLQNRRAMASYQECRRCGHSPHCPNCSVALRVYSDKVACHYCGYKEPLSAQCPKCSSTMESHGRGTQQIFEQLQELCPEAVVVRLDSDSLSENPHLLKEQAHWNIAVGTTLMLELPIWEELGMAAVLNVDNMLLAADFRVEEECYRTLVRMAQGCREQGAELIIQSSKLDHRAVTAALEGDYEEFYRTQILERKVPMFSPHSRMLKVSFRSENLDSVVNFASEIERRLSKIFAHRLSPLYQPAIERQRGEYIVEMTLKIERERSIAEAKKRLLEVVSSYSEAARRQRISIFVETL